MSASPQLSLNSILENVSHAGGTTSGNSGIPSFSLTMLSKSLTSFFPKLGGYFLGPDASWQTKLANSNSMYNSIYNAFENNCFLKMLNKEHIMYCPNCVVWFLWHKKRFILNGPWDRNIPNNVNLGWIIWKQIEHIHCDFNKLSLPLTALELGISFPSALTLTIRILGYKLVGLTCGLKCSLLLTPPSQLAHVDLRYMPAVRKEVGLLWGRAAIVQHIPCHFVNLRNDISRTQGHPYSIVLFTKVGDSFSMYGQKNLETSINKSIQ